MCKFLYNSNFAQRKKKNLITIRYFLYNFTTSKNKFNSIKVKEMKVLKKLSVFMLALLATVTITSCSSDDNNEVAAGAAKVIAGDYTSNLTCSVMGADTEFENVTVSIVEKDDATVDVKIGSFGNPPMQVPAFTIENVKVTGQDGNYTIANTNFEGTTENGKNYSGVLTGGYTGNKLSIKFNLQYGAMPMPMINTFESVKNAK